MMGMCPCGHIGATCMEHAATSFWRSFVLAYMVRAGVAVFTRGLGLMRGKSPRDVLKLEKLITKNHTHYREDAVRLGLFLGAFTGGYHIVRCNMCNRLGFSPKKAAAVAGAMGGLSSLFLKRKKPDVCALPDGPAGAGRVREPEEQQQVSLLGLALVARGHSAVRHVLGAGHVRDVMRPDTLDAGFWNFIVRAGPIDKETLGLIKDQCNGKHVDLRPALAARSVTGAMDAFGPVVGEEVRCVPCQLMHRSTGCPGCTLHMAMSAKDTFRKCFPFYLSIHLVPFGDPQRREGAEGSCRYRVQGDDCHRQVDVVHLSVCGALHGNGVSVPGESSNETTGRCTTSPGSSLRSPFFWRRRAGEPSWRSTSCPEHLTRLRAP